MKIKVGDIVDVGGRPETVRLSLVGNKLVVQGMLPIDEDGCEKGTFKFRVDLMRVRLEKLEAEVEKQKARLEELEG